MLKKHFLAVLVLILILNSFSSVKVLASRHELQRIVNFDGRLVPESLADRYSNRDFKGSGSVFPASFTSLSNLAGENFAVTRANGDQHPPDVAYNAANNNYLVVWDDDRKSASTGGDIYGQIVSSTGALTGNNFVINDAPGDQLYPVVAYNSVDNEYMVIWYEDQEGSVRGQRLSDTGALLGNSIFVCPSSDFYSSMAYNSRDNMYLVVSPVGDYTQFAGDVYGQLLSGDGVRYMPSFPISRADFPQGDPAVVYNSIDNEYMVVWMDCRNTNIFDLHMDVYGQLISGTGSLIGGNFAISPTSGIDWEEVPRVAHNIDLNEYLVVWYDDRNYPEEDIYGRLLGNRGGFRGSDFYICLANGLQDFPCVSYSHVGEEYLVVWLDGRNESLDIYGQRILDTGMLDGGNFAISTARYSQVRSESAYNSISNEYLVVWADERNKDTTGWDVYAQRVTSKDVMPPPAPSGLTSITHQTKQWSSLAQVTVEWIPVLDPGSGLDGYSIVWDQAPGTDPPKNKVLEETATQTTSPVLGSGVSHYFHIRAVDNAGNWGQTSHLGPFWIDVDAPQGVTSLSSATHPVSTWSSTRVVQVSWTPAQDSESELAGYSVAWDTIPDTLPGKNMNLGADAIKAESPQLSDGKSHYFHIRSVDNAGNWCGMAAHLGPFWIDGTAPTLVADPVSVPEPEVCSSEPVVHVMWTPATDEFSGLHGYSVVWDTTPDTLPDGTVELGADVTETASAELRDGNNHWFHIRSVDNIGNASDAAVHVGPFYINTAGPGPVTDLESTSHKVGVWSNDNTVDVQWTFTGDMCSVIDGYSIIWDDHADTLPDEIEDIEGDVTTVTSPVLTGGNIFYFHIRGVDTLGTWGETAHLGPFFIDVKKPSEPANLVSTTHTPGTWGSAQVVMVSWNPAQDSGSGLAGYSIVWDTLPDTLPEETMNLGAEVTEAQSPELADGDSHYFHIRSVDAAGNWCDTAIHIGPFFIDSTPPVLVTDLTSPSHPLETCLVDTIVQVTWTAAVDESSGLQGYSVVWDAFAETLPDNVVELAANVTTCTSPELPDGKSHYFHIRSVDNVGNALDEAVHIGPFYVDTTGPELVTKLQSASHQVSVWSGDDTVDVQWKVAVDQCSGVDGYSILWDDQPDTLPDDVKDVEEDATTATSPVLTSGDSHWFHIRGVDNLGNWSSEAAHLGPFFVDVDKPAEVTDLLSTTHTPGVWSSTQVVNVSWTPAQDAHSGLAGYSTVWDTSPDTMPAETMNLKADATKAQSPKLADGDSHYFHIRSVDGVGNWCDTAVHLGPFWTDGTPPALVTNLTSPSHLLETCLVDTIIQVTWTPAVDESSGLQGYSVVWDTSADTLPDDVVEPGADVTAYTSPKLPDGKSHYFHIRSVDNVGNALNEAVHIGPFYVDTEGPKIVTAPESISHRLNVWSGDDTVDVQWTVAVDQCSGVGGYSTIWTNQPDTLPDDVKDIEADVTTAASPALTSGDSHWFHIRGVDNLGNWSDEVAHLGPFFVDVDKPMEVADPTSVPPPGTWTFIQVVKVSWTPAQDAHSGLAGYSTVWDTSPDTLPEETMNLGAEVTEAQSLELADGDSHYFHIRSVDKVGNWCDTAAHFGPFYVDTTPPTLSMSGPTGKWLNESVVVVETGAADDLSGVKGYSLVWDGTPDTIPDEVQNADASETIESPELADGEWYLHARCVDNAGNWSDPSTAGPFMIDTGAPEPPGNLASDTHVPEEWSSDRVIGVGWSPATDNPSGLQGYSIVWDDQQGTIPDTVVELGPDAVYDASPELSDGSHWFHIRAIDNAGNGDQAELQLGPFPIDTTPPEPVKDLASTSHVVGEWSNNNVLEFTWTPSVDAGRGLGGYAVVIDNNSSTAPNTRNLDSNVTEFSSKVADGDKHWFHIRPVDEMGFWGETRHVGPFMIDTTPPPASFSLTGTPEPGVWSDQNTATVSWQRITDALSGLKGYSLSWSATPDNTIDLDPDKTSAVETLADGEHNFSIKAVDKAGNWSEIARLPTLRIDTTPPRSVRIYQITENSGVENIYISGNTVYYSALNAGAFTVYVAGTDSASGLKEALFPEATSSGGIVEDESGNANYSYSYQYQIDTGSGFDGQVSISLFDNAGNSADTSFMVSYDRVGPNTPANIQCDDGAKWNTSGDVKVTWSEEGDDGSGVANYYVEAENIEPRQNPGRLSATIPVDDGESIEIYVRGIDNVGNWGIAGKATISVDTQAPGSVQEIIHADSDANEGYDNDKELEFSWKPATDNIRVDHYQVNVSENGGAYKLLDSVDEEEYTVTGEDGKSYKLKVVAVDPAGNEGAATESEGIICDMSGPGFIVAMLPNPGFPNFMDIVVISLEKLLEEPPALSVDLAGKQDVTLSEITENVWVGNYIITGDGEATVVVKGTDLAGNVAEDKTNTFTTQTVLAGAPAHIQSTDGNLALDIPAGAFDRDTRVIMMAVPIDEGMLQSLGTVQLAPGLNAETGKLDELEAVGQHYLISPDDARFLKTVTLSLQYEDTADVNAKHISVYTWDTNQAFGKGLSEIFAQAFFQKACASEWKYADSVVDERTRSVRAQVKSFGTFGLYTDIKAPQIARISPSDGDVLDTSLPEFAIEVSDNGSGVNISSLSLLIDDQMVNVSRRSENGVVVLTPENGLTAGDHTFSIVGADRAGNDFASIRRNIRIPEWAVIPASSQLLQNYPNPFNPETWIPYRLSEPANVKVSIYSLSGQLVRTLELGTMKPGTYTDRERAIYWDGRNESGEAVSSGIYFYHLSAGKFSSIKKMVVAR